MKKSTLLKLALAFVAIFMFVGSKAQTNTGSVGATGWLVNTTLSDYTSVAGNKVTYGTTMPFFVWPSAAYNPNWDYSTIVPYATKATIIANVSSSFTWASTGTPLITHLAADKNYATINWPLADIGLQTITVTETPSSLVCAAVPVTFDVTVIDIPKFTITTGASKFGLNNLIQSNCWAALGNNTTAIPFTVGTAAETYPYAFYLDYKTYTVDGLDGSGNVPVTGGALTFPAAGVALLAYDSKVNGIVAGVPTKTNNPITVAAGTNLIPSTDFPCVSNKITVYEFDLSGYNAKVSRTSDYLDKSLDAVSSILWGTYTQYGVAGKYYIVSLPTPVTGPIYHIANTFGL